MFVINVQRLFNDFNINYNGILHTHYLSYIPVSYIALSCGRRPPTTTPSTRVVLLSCAHAHLVSPGLCIAVLAALRDLTNPAILKGRALYASVGAPCVWLALSLGETGGSLTPHLLAYNYVTSLIAVPLSTYTLCEQAVVPQWDQITETCLTILLPYYIGSVLLAPSRNDTHEVWTRVCALSLLYVECCGGLRDAEGVMHLRDVLLTLILEGMWLSSSVAACYAFARCGLIADEHALALALAGTPKSGFGILSSSVWCSWGVHKLPVVVAMPLRAILLANMSPQAEQQHDELQSPSRGN